jgi:hypothetical protein
VVRIAIRAVSGALRSAVGGAGSSAKVGVWANSNLSGRPVGAPLLADNTGAATTGTGQIALAMAGTLNPGTYWAGTKITGTGPQLTSANQILGYGVPNGNTLSALCISFADAYANALPTLAEGASFTMVTTPAPILQLNT